MKQIDLIKPDIYDRFQCKGTACRRTCCAGWRITVGKAEYQDLREKLHTAGKHLLQRLPEQQRTPSMYGAFVLEERKGCPLQSEEGLCSLQLSFGPEALPDVCAVFPRRGIRCQDQMQLSMTLACEGVLELLLAKEGPLEFVRQKEAIPPMLAVQLNGNKARVDWNRYMQLQEFCILLLQARDVSLDTRMALLGLGIHQIDAYYKRGEFFKVSAYIDRYLSLLSEDADPAARFPSHGLDPTILLGNFLSSLPASASSAGYPDVINKVIQALKVTTQQKEGTAEVTFSYSKTGYQQHRKRFAGFTERHPYFLENVMVMLFVLGHWASLPRPAYSLWEQYMYACWVYSNLKFVLTACMEEDTTEEALLDVCVVLFRSWLHSEEAKKLAIKQLHENKSDTPAHMAMLVQAG